MQTDGEHSNGQRMELLSQIYNWGTMLCKPWLCFIIPEGEQKNIIVTNHACGKLKKKKVHGQTRKW